MKARVLKIFVLAALQTTVVGSVFAKAKEKSASKSKAKPAASAKKNASEKTTTTKKASSNKVAAPSSKPTRYVGSNTDRKFDDLRRSFRTGEKDSPGLWADLQAFDGRINDLSKDNQVALLQAQSGMLLRGGYPYTSALFSADALERAKNPMANSMRPTWNMLWQASQKRSMQSMLENLASNLKGVDSAPPGFGNAWYYYEGNAAQARGDSKEAIANYDKLRINDYHFLSAKYQTGMVHYANERLPQAELALKTMLNSVSQTMAPLPAETKKELSNYAKLGLGRLYYQEKQFKTAIKFYRAVDRDSPEFYNSLFEQSWAFFMAGYPNHALGALYGVESPFFKDKFNPEAPLLRAIAYYWMCRYDNSKAALSDFTDRHADAIESLSGFLDRKRLTEETAYQLFEDYTAGVSASSLGIPRGVLEAAATEDSMMSLRDQYAGLVAELDRMQGVGVFGSKRTDKATELLNRQIKNFRKAIGGQYIVELQSLKSHFDRLYEQSQFLYVELLMSEKEQLLGRELHASNKMDRVSQRKNIAGWGDKTQAWGDNKLNEFWWDEVGFYILNVQPMCKTGS